MGPRVTSKKLPVIRALLGIESQDDSEAAPAGEGPEEAGPEGAADGGLPDADAP
jgi:hypothetical protein